MIFVNSLLQELITLAVNVFFSLLRLPINLLVKTIQSNGETTKKNLNLNI